MTDVPDRNVKRAESILADKGCTEVRKVRVAFPETEAEARQCEAELTTAYGVKPDMTS